MIGAHVLTVGVVHLAEREDPAGLGVARALLGAGLAVAARAVVDEDEGALEAALRPAVLGGGLAVILAAPGGSAGEIVRRVVARLAGARLVLNDRFLTALEEEFSRRGQAMPRRLDRLALLPRGAEVWAAAGSEPGWALAIGPALLAVLPAGAGSLAPFLDAHLVPAARARPGTAEVSLQRTLRTTGVPAAEIEERLAPWLGKEGPVAVSCHPAEGDTWVRLVARGASRALAEAALREAEVEVAAALEADCYGRDAETLEAVVGRLLVERGLRLAVAESCTAGLLCHRLTNVPGSSRYLERGVVVYANEAKEALLGVPGDLLRAHGAVSAPVARAMVAGICASAGAPCGLAVTGIAGPDGGTPDKPVGTVFIAVASPAGSEVRRFRFSGSREAIKWQSSQAALDLLRRALLR